MDNVRRRLEAMVTPEHRAFAEKIIKGGAPILGVKSAGIQKLLKEVLAGDWRTFLEMSSGDVHEELVLLGLVIVSAPMPLAERLQRLRGFVPKIDSWAVCDSVCARLQFAEEEAEAGWSSSLPISAMTMNSQYALASSGCWRRFCVSRMYPGCWRPGTASGTRAIMPAWRSPGQFPSLMSTFRHW